MSEITATLLIPATAHRMRIRTLINIQNISKSPTGVSIKILDLIKTSRSEKDQSILTVPFFKKETSCVASIISTYLKKTENLRSNFGKLSILMIKPHKLASAQAINHWIQPLLTTAEIDVRTFSVYSIKHAAVFKAGKQGSDIYTIRTAGWSAGSMVFVRFYNLPIQAASDSFANTIINKNT